MADFWTDPPPAILPGHGRYVVIGMDELMVLGHRIGPVPS